MQVLDQITIDTTPVKEVYIIVVQLVDGRIAITQAANACLAICSLNSGVNPALPKSHLIKSIVGIKPANEERTYIGTVAYFCNKYGEDKVLAL